MALYLVSTPIGNLDDITPRAQEALRQADLVAAEDTRRTRRLLRHFDIPTRLKSYHQRNEVRRTEEILADLKKGLTIALVTSSGTPCISDPGYRLVRAAIDADIPVIPIPGQTALIPALVISGLPVHEFHFFGFCSKKSGERRRRLARAAEYPGSLIFYESPHRIDRFLADALEVLGDRRACLCRELTKLHEEAVRGPLSELLERVRSVPPPGELVVVIEGRND